MARQVTEQDLRAPAFRDGTPDDYEYRSDGKIVRKDRFRRGMQDIAAIVFGDSNDYEIPDVIAAVYRLKGVQAEIAIARARDVYESEPKALECLDYLEQMLKPNEGPR